MSKTVKLQIIQFSISTQFKCKYGLIVKAIQAIQFSQLNIGPNIKSLVAEKNAPGKIFRECVMCSSIF